MFVLNKKLLFLKNVFKLDQPIVLRIFLDKFLVKTINVETNFIEKEIYDCGILKDIFFVFRKLFETNLDESVFLNDLFENFLGELFFWQCMIIEIFETFHDGRHDFFLLNRIFEQKFIDFTTILRGKSQERLFVGFHAEIIHYRYLFVDFEISVLKHWKTHSKTCFHLIFLVLL